jgi:hypothetical protein
MSDSKNRNALVLKIEYHRQMAAALSEDASSKSDHIFSKQEHEKCQAMSAEPTIKESLKKAANFHREMHEQYLKEYKTSFPTENYEEIYLEREDWMVDEIWGKATPFEDPELQSKEDQATKN